MPIYAYILLKVGPDRNKKILDKIKSLDETLEAFILFGAYDIIIKGEFKSKEDMGRFLSEKLKAIPGILETQTNICAEC